MRHIIAVIDTDIRFALKLSDFLSKEDRIPFKAVAYTSFQMYSNESSSMETVAFITDIDNVDECIETGLPVVLLSDDAMVESKYTGSSELFCSIFKFCGVHIIVDELLGFFSGNNSFGLTAGNKNTKVYGVYSPINRCGRTSLSVAFHSYFCSQENSSLLISFDEYDSLFSVLRKENSRDLSDVFYGYKTGDLNFAKLGECISRVEDLNIVLPARYNEDLFYLSDNELTKFMNDILSANLFEVIVIDFGSIGRRSMQILDMCEKIFCPVIGENNSVEMTKISEFKSLLGRNGYAEIIHKIYEMRLPKEDISADIFNFTRLKRREYFLQVSKTAEGL